MALATRQKKRTVFVGFLGQPHASQAHAGHRLAGWGSGLRSNISEGGREGVRREATSVREGGSEEGGGREGEGGSE